MEWKAIITIYLAVGAPFAAAHWFRADPEKPIWRRMVVAVLTAMVWPYAAVRSTERLRAPQPRVSPRESDKAN